MNTLTITTDTYWSLAAGWLLVAAAFLLVPTFKDTRSASTGGMRRGILMVHAGSIAVCLTFYVAVSAAVVVLRTIPAEAARTDLEFETGALSVAERLAAGTADVAYPEAGASSDGTRFSLLAGPDGATVRIEDATLASCASVLTGLSRRAKSMLIAAHEMDGNTSNFRPLADWATDCPKEGARADLVLRRRLEFKSASEREAIYQDRRHGVADNEIGD